MLQLHFWMKLLSLSFLINYSAHWELIALENMSVVPFFIFQAQYITYRYKKSSQPTTECNLLNVIFKQVNCWLIIVWKLIVLFHLVQSVQLLDTRWSWSRTSCGIDDVASQRENLPPALQQRTFSAVIRTVGENEGLERFQWSGGSKLKLWYWKCACL